MMMTGISFAEFARQAIPSTIAYFNASAHSMMVYKGAISLSDGFELLIDYRITQCSLKYMTGKLCIYSKLSAGMNQQVCEVQVASCHWQAPFTRLRFVDISEAVSIEPTEENALIILEQISYMERVVYAQEKV